MKALINHHVDLKISIYATRFLSSLASLQNPSVPSAKPQNQSNFFTTFDPYLFLNKSVKSRDYTLQEIKIIHTHFLKTKAFHSNSEFLNFLLRNYSKASGCDYALKLFDAIPHPDINSWNLIITSLNQNSRYAASWETFCRLHSLGFNPNEVTYGSGLSACIASNFVNCGKLLFSLALKHGFSLDGYVRSGMIDLFLKSCSFNDALRIFYDESCGNVVCWNAIISGAIKHNEDHLGLNLFQKMCRGFPSPNKFTFPSVFGACAKLQELELGKGVHGLVVKYGEQEDLVVSTAIVDFYAKCGQVNEAVKKFSQMSIRNVVSWTAIITGFVQKGYAQNGYVKEALHLFLELISSGLEIDSFTISSVLGAVGDLDLNHSDIGIGNQLHAFILKLGYESEASVGSSLIMMYSKYGNLDDCQKGFNRIKKPDLISWTAMINSYAQHGKGLEALKVYKLMTKSGTKPDSVTFVGVLAACSHSGLVNEGYSYLKSMVQDYGIQPGQRHYACMVDVLGRSGRLKEAETFIRSMPIEPDSLVWGTLLAACKVHGDVEIGKIAAAKFIELEPSSDGGYVAFSNICADVGQWEEVLKIRNEMKGTGIKKQPGWSYV